jgi:malonyl-CoA O-methyltransferase
VNRIVTNKASVAASFSAAAATYEEGADVQLKVAQQLTARISKLPLPENPRILEIGCGTGFLTRSLRKVIGGASWIVTDISLPMTLNCRASIEEPQRAFFGVMDGEAPCFAPGEHFDLICSSLAFQWFENLPGSLANLAALLRPGGHMAFSTLAAGSFSEWRRAYDNVSEKPSVLNCLPTADILRAMPGGNSEVDEERMTQPYANGHAFLKKLRQIGAHIPPKGQRPATAGTLRRVLQAFDLNAKRHVSYHVAYGQFTRG